MRIRAEELEIQVCSFEWLGTKGMIAKTSAAEDTEYDFKKGKPVQYPAGQMWQVPEACSCSKNARNE